MMLESNGGVYIHTYKIYCVLLSIVTQIVENCDTIAKLQSSELMKLLENANGADANLLNACASKMGQVIALMCCVVVVVVVEGCCCIALMYCVVVVLNIFRFVSAFKFFVLYEFYLSVFC